MEKLSTTLAELYLYNISYSDNGEMCNVDSDLQMMACFSNNISENLVIFVPIILNYVPKDKISYLPSHDKPLLKFVLENDTVYPDIPFLKHIPQEKRASFMTHIRRFKEILENEMISICDNEVL